MESQELKVEVGSRIEYLDLLHAMAEEMAKLAGLDEGGRFNFALAVREAATNAVLHGNDRDPAKLVTIKFSLSDQALCARIKDQGAGFDFQGTADPRLPENRFKPSGRGLLLIKAFVDEVAYRHEQVSGTEIELIKFLAV